VNVRIDYKDQNEIASIEKRDLKKEVPNTKKKKIGKNIYLLIFGLNLPDQVTGICFRELHLRVAWHDFYQSPKSGYIYVRPV
jgi:hypothetical protein